MTDRPTDDRLREYSMATYARDRDNPLARPGQPTVVARMAKELLEARKKLPRLLEERDEARATAKVLAHAYETDSRPPPKTVARALAYPVRSKG